MDNRVKSGIIGLDELVGGGFIPGSVNVVTGGTGVGKSFFCMQYILHGLNRGEQGVFLSFEMSRKQLIKQCESIGWDEVKDHISDGRLKIIQLYGEDLVFPTKEIPYVVESDIKGDNNRIAIDPLTYLTFSFANSDERRSLSELFESLRERGTSIISIEEIANLVSSPRGVVPLYLADSVVTLRNLGYGEEYNRTLQITKFRGSRHGEGLYPVSIQSGLGIVVETTPYQLERIAAKKKFDAAFQAAEQRAAGLDGTVGKVLAQRIGLLRRAWVRDDDPTQLLEKLLSMYE